jgi:cytochrome c peroxidase
MSHPHLLRFFVPSLAVIVVLVMGLFLFKENAASITPLSISKAPRPTSDAVTTPIPQPPALDPRRLALGEKLFKEVKLSADNTLACVSCHDLGRGGVDRQKVSTGVGGAKGEINAPTVFNSSLSFVQFWNGRAATLEEQAAGPIHNPLEMASDWKIILPKLQADPDYVDEFSFAYRDGLTSANILNALATFERSLLTPDSRFDRYLRGEIALSKEEQTGYRLFRDLGCAACHQGVLLGGNMYQRFGVLREYYRDKTPNKADLGRYNVTSQEADRHVFKVPSLRNIALTAPYFHDASASTLEEAVTIMGRYQLGRELAAQDVQHIVAFLHTLTGQWQGKPLQ